MTPEQCMQARELLGWSRVRLATMSGTNPDFIQEYENLGRVRNAQSGPRGAQRLQAVLAALKAAGVEFTNGEAPGVRLRKAEP